MIGVFELILLVLGVVLAAVTHQLSVGQGSNIGLALGVVGLVVAMRQPRNPMGWILLGAAGCLLISGLCATYSVLDYRAHHGALPLGPVAVFLEPTWAPAVVLLGLTLLVFPDGKLPSPRWRWVLWVVLAAGTAFQLASFGTALAAVVTNTIHVTPSGDLAIIDNPHGSYAWYGYVEWSFFAVLAAVALAWFARQIPAYRRSTGERRLQQKWFLSGATIFVICGFLTLTLGSLGGTWDDIAQGATIGMLALPISIGIGILKYRLYDIDRLISRTIAYAIVTALVIGTYVAVITLTTKALGFSSPVAVAASTLAAVALFSPLRRRTQHVVDRRFNRAHYDAEATVAAFTARLRDAVDLETVRTELLEVVNRAVEPAHATVWIRRRE